MATESAVTKDKLVQDFKVVVADVEELLRATASQAGEKVSAVREKVQDSLHRAKVKLAEAEDVLVDKGKQAARVTDEYVHDHPWRAVGVAAGIGLIDRPADRPALSRPAILPWTSGEPGTAPGTPGCWQRCAGSPRPR